VPLSGARCGGGVPLSCPAAILIGAREQTLCARSGQPVMPPVGDASRLWLPTLGNRAGADASVAVYGARMWRRPISPRVRNGRALLPTRSNHGLRNQPIGHRDSRSQRAAL
jgi:hypothetical protein